MSSDQKFLLSLIAMVFTGIAFAGVTNLSSDGLLHKLIMPVAVGDITHNTNVAVVGTTEIEAVTADVAAAQRTKNNLQVITVTNQHASQNVCFFVVEYNSENCETTCAAATRTCDGTAATDGAYILASTQRTFSIWGDQCGCLVGSAASTTFSADRIYR